MLSRLSLRYSIPLLLALFALVVELTLIGIHIPRSEREAEAAWREHASQLLAVVQGNVNDHLRLQRREELDGMLSDLSSLEGVHWAAVVDSQLQPLASSRLGLDLGQLALQADTTSTPRWLPQGKHHYLAVYPLRAGNGLNGQSGHTLLVNWDFTPMIHAQRQ